MQSSPSPDTWKESDRLERRIDRAAYAAYANATIIGVLGLAVLMSRDRFVGTEFLAFAPVAALLALGYWCDRSKNPLAPTLLLLLTIWIDGGIWLRERSALALVLLVLFGSFYLVAIPAAIQWHRLARNRHNATGLGAGA